MGFTNYAAYLVWLNEGVRRIHHQTAGSKSKLGTLVTCQVLSGMSDSFHEFVGVTAAGQFNELLQSQFQFELALPNECQRFQQSGFPQMQRPPIFSSASLFSAHQFSASLTSPPSKAILILPASSNTPMSTSPPRLFSSANSLALCVRSCLKR